MPKDIMDDIQKLAGADTVSAAELVREIIIAVGGVKAAAQIVAEDLLDDGSKTNKVNAMVSLIRVLDKDAPKDAVGLPFEDDDSITAVLDAAAAERSGPGYE